MAIEGNDRTLPDVYEFMQTIQNELATNAFNIENEDVRKTIKTCVLHVILKAIALSKDPRMDKAVVMTLYDTASELVANSHLDEDENVQNRLQDLINAVIDGDDLSAQLRLYSLSNRQWMESRNLYLDNKIAILMQEITEVKSSLDTVSRNVNPSNTYLKKKPNTIVLVVSGILAMLFTIITSVVIISVILTSAINNEGSPNDKNLPPPLIQKDRFITR
jgi:hypothetical protein